MNNLAYNIAERFINIKEMGGELDNPMIVAMLKLDNEWPQHDEVPWCSAFTNYICWLLRLPRSKSLMARSWLEVGRDVDLADAELGDIVVLMRGEDGQPGPEVIQAPGHVGFYSSQTPTHVEVLGGNQSNTVKVSRYEHERLLSVRRLV